MDWLNSPAATSALMVASAVLAVLAVVLLVLWLSARTRLRRVDRDWTSAERTRIDLELSLAEQTGRLGIVRDLQDVAVHAVGRLVSQAEGAKYTAESDPSSAVRAVTGVVDAGRTALGDMRRVLTVAREGESLRSPQPGLQSAQNLFRVMRDAGLVISFEESGERYELKPGAELAVYRILQAALANSLKHGGVGTEARVSFVWTEEGLQVTIDDDGIRAALRREGDEARADATSIDDDLRALTETISGAGISQMRQRAELFGGVFSANSVPGVGFSVSAVFPALRFHNGVHGVELAR
ncbi:sensor histidine kinase [Leifsonia flava]|uniref:histidine kinase n=1 Tax=Orlajensenia leifsoniae TaxID=2561933 RepID=A0A4Y9R4I4_9MICO|nr:ATP-binding protein [Leifsonia flava]TFV99220.1 ATP-binding protein [Leifsonia flava]